MQAVQGCGKTTLVEQLQELFTHVGLQAASISIDDFYLPYEGQQELIKVSALPYRLEIYVELCLQVIAFVWAVRFDIKS